MEVAKSTTASEISKKAIVKLKELQETLLAAQKKLLETKNIKLQNQISLNKDETNEQYIKLHQDYIKELDKYNELLNKNEHTVKLFNSQKES